MLSCRERSQSQLCSQSKLWKFHSESCHFLLYWWLMLPPFSFSVTQFTKYHLLPRQPLLSQQTITTITIQYVNINMCADTKTWLDMKLMVISHIIVGYSTHLVHCYGCGVWPLSKDIFMVSAFNMSLGYYGNLKVHTLSHKTKTLGHLCLLQRYVKGLKLNASSFFICGA